MTDRRRQNKERQKGRKTERTKVRKNEAQIKNRNKDRMNNIMEDTNEGESRHGIGKKEQQRET